MKPAAEARSKLRTQARIYHRPPANDHALVVVEETSESLRSTAQEVVLRRAQHRPDLPDSLHGGRDHLSEGCGLRLRRVVDRGEELVPEAQLAPLELLNRRRSLRLNAFNCAIEDVGMVTHY